MEAVVTINVTKLITGISRQREGDPVVHSGPKKFCVCVRFQTTVHALSHHCFPNKCKQANTHIKPGVHGIPMTSSFWMGRAGGKGDEGDLKRGRFYESDFVFLVTWRLIVNCGVLGHPP